jgi:hypothetical protein
MELLIEHEMGKRSADFSGKVQRLALTRQGNRCGSCGTFIVAIGSVGRDQPKRAWLGIERCRQREASADHRQTCEIQWAWVSLIDETD